MSILSDIIITLGFISLMVGLYLYDLKIALVVGGCILILFGLMVARNVNRKATVQQS